MGAHKMSDLALLVLGLITERGAAGISMTELLDGMEVMAPGQTHVSLRMYPYDLCKKRYSMKAIHDGLSYFYPGPTQLDAQNLLCAQALAVQVLAVRPVLQGAVKRSPNVDEFSHQCVKAGTVPSRPMAPVTSRSVFDWRGPSSTAGAWTAE